MQSPILKYCIFSLMVLLSSTLMAQVFPSELKCEYLDNPLGIDNINSRLSWKIIDKSNSRGQKQTAYRLLVSSSLEALNNDIGDLWDSKKVSSDQSALVAYSGKMLQSNQVCYWKVRVYDMKGNETEWSKPAHFSMGLLSPDDWKSPWLVHPDMPSVNNKTNDVLTAEQHLWFRRKIDLTAVPKNAFIHLASCGYHKLFVNGMEADDRVLAPSQTRLDKRILYVTYDISKLLTKGTNLIAIATAPGWSRYETFKTRQAFRLQLDGDYANGEKFAINDGTGWKCHKANSINIGNIKYLNHGGERIDGRLYLHGWNTLEFDDTNWTEAISTNIETQLSAHLIDPTRIIKTIPAVKMLDTPNYRFDMGENFTGFLNIKIRHQQKGDTIRIKVADDIETIQDFAQLNEYICNGEGEEYFQNQFNYIAGRYVTIEGLSEMPKPDDVTAFALSNDFEQTGKFNSSNPLFNKIYETDLWTFRANTTEGFTADCPHRERLGYGEVAFATSWGIGFPNYDAATFYLKNIQDWADVQRDNGYYYHTAPQINHHYGGPMWSSAGINMAQAFYEYYGDVRAYEIIYPSAIKWLSFLSSSMQEGLLVNFSTNKGHFLGDWAAPNQRKEWGNTVEAQYFNNCVFAMNLQDVIKMAKVLNKPSEAQAFERQLDALRKAIHNAFFDSSRNIYMNGTLVQQTFALMTGIVPEENKELVFEKIKNDLTADNAFLDMGSSGLPVVFKYMTEMSGKSEWLYKSLSRKTEPSYGYFIERGETTWPEYWNVDVPSRIHTCYTGVSSWMMKSLAGIRPDYEKPGFQSFIIEPIVAGELNYAEASTESLYGTITSKWERTNNQVKYSISIPPNSMAKVILSATDYKNISESQKDINNANGVKFLYAQNGKVALMVESGKYEFMVNN